MRTIGAPQRPSRWLDELTARARASPLIRGVADATRLTWPFALFGWFAWQTYHRLSLFAALNFPIGIDAHIYYRGVVAWLRGGDPWSASVAAGGAAYHYSGTPVTTVILAPAALLDEGTFTVVALVATWLAAVFILRRVRLPLWWLLFPPISEALFSANPQIVVLALLLVKGPWAAAIGTALKVYAFIPLVGEARWRAIAIAVAFNAATVPFAVGLWAQYIDQFQEISNRLARRIDRRLFRVLRPTAAGADGGGAPAARTPRPASGGLACGAGHLAVEPTPLLHDGAPGHVAHPRGRPRGTGAALPTAGDPGRDRAPAGGSGDHQAPS